MPPLNPVMRLLRSALGPAAGAGPARVRMLVEEMEPRILHSADFVPGAFGDALSAPVELRVLEAVPESANAETAAQHNVSRELVIVDRATPDYQALIDGIVANAGPGRSIEVVLLDAEQDGVTQITDALSSRHDLDAVHLISHGAEGALNLGSGILDAAALEARAAEIAEWGNALASHADLLIYGCDVAASFDGRTLVDRLAQLTGADVAASEDATGSAALGGDWNLEYHAGAVEARLAVDAHTQSAWAALLDTATLQASHDTYLELDATGNNYGQSTDLIVNPHAGKGAHALLQFDLSTIPAGSQINSAVLKLQATTGASVTIGAYEVTEAWSEGAGNGAAGTPNWNQRAAATAWTTPGGTHNPTAVATADVTTVGQKTWNITSLVQAWMAGTKTNNGVMLAATASGGNNDVRFDSAEGTTKPVLEIDYTAPIPVTLESYDVALADLHDNGFEVTSGQSWGQTLRYDSAGATYSIDRVQVVLSKAVDAAPGQTLTVSLRSSWNGAAIASGTVSSDTLATSEGWITFDLANAATLNDNQTYYLRVDSDGGGKVYLGATNAGAYAAGDLINKDGNAEVGKDMAFRMIDLQINAAPVLSGANNLTAINEDPASNGGTLVSSLIAGRVSDSNEGAVSGIAVTAVTNTNGTWQYSTNSGGAWNNFGTPAAASARLLAADANTYVRFVPAAGWHGTVTNGLTFRAWDQTSGTAGATADASTNGGTTAFGSASRSSSITVNSVNDAPAGTSATVSTNEDVALVLNAAHFGFSDANDSPADTLSEVRFASVPGAGVLALNGVAVTAGQSVGIADINAGRLIYTPAQDASGAGYASFTFQVRDSGGTANGGIDLDPVARTLTIDVTAVNDAPEHTMPGAQSTLMNTPIVFSTGNANAITVGDVDAAGAVVRVTLSATNGVLTLGGTAGLTFSTGTGSGNASMTFEGTIAAVNTALDGLRYDPTAAYSGLAQLDITTNDLGNAGAGGARSTTNAIVLNVAFVNTPPTLNGANNLSNVPEDAASNSGTLVSALIAGQVSDPNLAALSGIAVTAVDNTNGAWQYSTNGGSSWSAFGAPTSAAARLLAADANTFVRFVPNANWNGTVANGIYFHAWDQTSGTAGATADTTEATYTVRDEFTGAGYANQNGTANWSTNWIESDASGLISMTGSELRLNGALLGNGLIYREANLAGATSATLTFDYNNALTALASAKLEISDDGGGSWRELAGSFAAGSNSASFNIGGDVAANTRLRFSVSGVLGGGNMTVDNFEISYVKPLVGGSTAFSAASRSSSVTVSALNDAPAGANKTVTTNEDAAYTFTAADFGFTDAVEGNNLLAVKVTTLPGAGTVRNDGVVLTAGAFVTKTDIDSGKLVYTPGAHGNGTGYASFTFQVQDDGGTANGGVDLDTVARTITVDVTGVSDAPAGADSTVSILEDNALTLTAAHFGFADAADGNNLLAVKIAALPLAGALTLDGAAVVAGQVVTASDIDLGKLVFTPASNANGASYASFTFQVQDDGGTANGGADVDASANTLTIDVTAVNDAPTGADKTVATNEDSNYAFARADFGFTDAVEGHALLAVKITSLPADGTLKYDGLAVTAGQLVTAVDIDDGKLVYTPASNANGAGHASFTFQVQDSGGTGNGGVDLDTTARTMTIDVTAVNDAPSGTNKTVTVLEDGSHTFTAADFGFTDAVEGNALLSVRISTLPGAGTLTLSGVAVNAGDFVTKADIDLGRLVFTPVSNANGAGYASFTFQVRDDGGTANGGVDLDASANTITVNVTSVNDAPAGTNKTVTTNEDSGYTFTTADFGFTDALDGNALLSVRIAALPGAGTLTSNGVAVSAGDFVAKADIDLGRLVFTPAANANGAGYASFTFQVRDDGGTANGGVDLDASANTITVNVTAVNDAPAGANKTVTVLEDGSHTFTAADFGFTDAVEGNDFLSVRIATLPGAGTLTSNGVAVSAGDFVTRADIDLGRLVFTPAANANGAGYASFTFQVRDDGGTANGGVDLDASANTITVNVTSVNDAPAGANKTVTILEDGSHTFTAADFGFTDAVEGNAFLSVRIATLPGAGTLTSNGVAVSAGDFVTKADIDLGRLVFTPAANANGAGYASFTFQVRDDGGTANGGVDLDQSANTITINVTAVNDAPVLAGANNLGGINEDATGNGGTLVSALIAGRVSDADAGALTGIAVTGVVNTNGTWQYSTNAGASWQSFGSPSAGTARLLAADANTYVRFVPDSNWNGTVANGLTFRAWDQTLGANGGVAPTIANPVLLDNFNTNSYSNNNGTAQWTSAWVDSDGDVANGDIHVRDSTLHIHADHTSRSLYREADLSGAQSATLSFDYDYDVNFDDDTLVRLQISSDGGASYTTLRTFSDSTSGSGTYSQDVSAWISAATRIRFLVADGDGGEINFDDLRLTLTAPGNGGTAPFSTATASSSITVAAVNDAPRGANNTVVATEDTTGSFTASMFGFSDSVEGHALSGVKITTLASAGTLTLNGVAVTAGQVVSAADIDAGLLRFRADADANGTGYATFTFQVQDDGGTANGGVDLDATARTMTVNVTAVNDAPVLAGSSNLPAINEDVTSSSGLLVSDLIAGHTSDADTGALSGIAVIAVDNTSGTWQYTLDGSTWSNFGSPGAASARLLNADADNRIRFVPDANWNGSAGITFRAWDRTSGVSGLTANTTANGDATAFSAATASASITVNSVNDRPSGANNTVTTNEDTPFVFTAAAFGFSDSIDTNNLLAVKVATLPGAGSLTLSGVAVTAGQFVSRADIDAGRLVYAPAANAKGAGYASFTFQVQDDGGTANGGVDLAVARTMTIDVASVADAPAGASNTVSTNEDTPFVFTTAAFGFGDPADGNALLAVRIASTPASGTLTLNGAAVVAGQSIAASDIAAGKLVYAPAANANGAGYASFTFRVQDDGGTANGGIDLDPVARTMTIDVVSVNDRPTGTSSTVTIDEDTALVLTTAHFGFADAADAPANNFSAVRIGTVSGGGALRLSGAAVAAGQFVTVADIDAGRLVYTPAPNANGTAYASIRFQVQDDGGTANGGSNLAVTRTLSVDVASVNDAPAGADTTVGTLESTPFVFEHRNFGLTDAADAGANALLSVKILSLPVVGSLTLGGVGVTAGQVVSRADIDADRLVYTPVAGESALGYAAFTFQVQDDGGTARGGLDLDPVARTLTIDVGAINHAPVGTSATVSVLEDGSYVFGTVSFGFNDPNDGSPHNLLAVKISSVPGTGALTLAGTAVSAGQWLSVADIAAGRLVYTPVANANGAGYASFTFQVQDDGGTLNGGIDIDPTARTLTVDVLSVNDAPAGASRTVTTNEDTAFVFDIAHFGFSDAADGNALNAVRIGSVPVSGALTLNGVAVTAGDFVSAADIAAGQLVFMPGTNANGAGYASFDFQVQDDGGTADGGSDIDGTARTMTLNVTSVNDAPSGTSRTVTTNEDTAFVFGAAHFGFSDAADGNALGAVKIASVPAAGALTLNGVAVAAGDFVSAADIAAGRLVFTPIANAYGAGYASFTFQVQDDGGTADGGSDIDGTARTMTVNVTSVNDAPSGASLTVTTNEDAAFVFGTAHFGFSDAADGNAWSAVKIASVPPAGALTLNGVAVSAGDFVSVADIAAGKLVFTPAANGNGAGYASFTFRVQDDGGTANGGVDTDQTARTMTVNVTRVNDAPAGADVTVTTNEDIALVLTAATFGFTDAADGNSLQAVKFASVPGSGTLTLSGTAVSAGQFVSAADIAAGKLVYAPAANASGAGYASFTFQVQDDGGTAGGGSDLDATARTITVNVTGVNDAPSGTDRTLTIAEDGAHALSVADFGYSDAADANALHAVRIGAVPQAGALKLNGAAVSAGQYVSAADIAAGRLVYAPAAHAHGAGYASFTFQVQDDGGTAYGGADLDATARTMTVNVTAVNDAPTGRNESLAMSANASLTLNAAHFGFSDPNDAPSHRLTAVKISTLPTAGTLLLNGTAIAGGQHVAAADIAAGRLVYSANGGAGRASFTFQVQDDGGAANGGVDLDTVARTMAIDVAAPPPVFQEPVNEPVVVIPPPVSNGGVSNSAPSSGSQSPSSGSSSSSGGSSSGGSSSGSSSSGSGSSSSGSSGDSGSGSQASGDGGGLAGGEASAGGNLADASIDGQAGAPGGAPARVTAGDDSRGAAVGATASSSPTAQGQVTVQRLDSGQALKDARDLGTFMLGEVNLLAPLGGDGLGGTISLLTQAQSSSSSGVLMTEEARALGDELDQLRDSMRDQGRLESATVAATAATGMSLSVGYVVWLLRGGALLSTFLSSLPAWRFVDPLPVLGNMEDGDDGDDDSLETLVTANDAVTASTEAGRDRTNTEEPTFLSGTSLDAATGNAAVDMASTDAPSPGATDRSTAS